MSSSAMFFSSHFGISNGLTNVISTTRAGTFIFYTAMVLYFESQRKKLDSYKIPFINLSTENLDMEPLKYGLHDSRS